MIFSQELRPACLRRFVQRLSDMSNLVEDGAAAVYNRAADEARTLAELLNTLAELGVKNEG